jgi:hypothetical protein
VPDIFVIGPNDFRQAIPVRKVAERTYRGETHIGARTGLFRIRPLEESRLFPETGLYRQEEEMIQFGSNENLLRRVSHYSGGRFNPQPAQVFDCGPGCLVSQSC